MTDRSGHEMNRVKVWDVPTRVVHWALVFLIAFLWWSEKSDDIARHKLAGFALVSLLLFRFYWGVVGANTSRFASFVRGPREIWRYVRGRTAAYLGHNPLGGWSVIALLFVLTAESLTGLIAIDEDGLESGPFAANVGFDWARVAAHWHALIFKALLALIALHVAAILFYWMTGRNLITPMVTGLKRVAAGIQEPASAPFWSFLVGVAIAVAGFLVLWYLDNN